MGQKRETALMLRTCEGEELVSHDGFRWKPKGWTECQDWSPVPQCGNGLHGMLWGEGNASLIPTGEDCKWLVAEVYADEIVDLDGNIKVPRARVLHVGDQASATQFLYAHSPNGKRINYLTITGGYWSTITGGDNSVITGGDLSALTGGDWSTLTGGDQSTIKGGDQSTITGGDNSVITGGDLSTITGGNWSILTGGYESTITGGDNSVITGGDLSTITGGYRSTITGGEWSTITGGEWSTIKGDRLSTLTGGDLSTITGGYNSALTGGKGATLIFEYTDKDGKRCVKAIVIDGQEYKPGVKYKITREGVVLEV